MDAYSPIQRINLWKEEAGWKRPLVSIEYVKETVAKNEFGSEENT